MPNLFIVAAGAALTLSASSVIFAYSGDLAMGKGALAVMNQFDTVPGATSAVQAPVVADSKPSQSTPPQHAAAKPVRDEFQRYFDRHYRAHLVLDAAAHGFFEVE